MKTKSSILALVAVTALLQAAPPQAPASTAEDLAKRKVATEIYAKVNRMSGSFSRAAPGPSHQLEFQPQMLVKEESRLPFTISPSRNPKVSPQLQGYVRLSDQQIFLLDAKTGKHHPAYEDPRFAPALLPKVEPAKPL
ncbi:hypothetical protein OKA05_14290 [Luteolibacter arcticus]|uniref:Uncharacterized protein n=1 Tax=Luteolibacter arcticus TaxID=1581411 RepID=A0ABT3GJR0_9BACT|nr:hypothetical protein [Luteolibacter arcticus]MCW1923732.1 hypothetical protein [Luteolibacter arcticus]